MDGVIDWGFSIVDKGEHKYCGIPILIEKLFHELKDQMRNL